jgi:UDP-N-acetylglucosamine transferase subunit ALG13
MTVPFADAPLKIFVTVGTHEQGFPRLLSAVSEIIADDVVTGAKWRVQTGPASVTYPESVDTQPACTHDEMLSHLRWADVMVSQASPGNVFTALAMGTQPLVIARRHDLSEHVDDHQIVFARYLSESGLAMVADSVTSLTDHLDRLRTESPAARGARLAQLQSASVARTESWVTLVDDAIRELFRT